MHAKGEASRELRGAAWVASRSSSPTRGRLQWCCIGSTETITGNVFELQATDKSGRREVTLRVKTKSSGDWQTTTTIGEPREEKQAETKFWILLDTGQRGADGPGFSSCRTGGCVTTSMTSLRLISAPTVGSGP